MLRRRAFSEVKESKGRDSWPPKFEDPFESASEVAEISAGDLTLEILGGALRHRGYLIVRGLIPRSTTDRLVSVVQQALAAQNAWHGGAAVSATTPWYVPEPGSQPHIETDAHKKGLPVDMNRVFLADSPRAMFEVAEAYRQVGIDRLVSEYLGDRPIMIEKKWLLWRMDRKADVFQFHQEASVFNSGPDGMPHPDGTDPAPLRAVNLWIALSPLRIDIARAPVHSAPHGSNRGARSALRLETRDARSSHRRHGSARPGFRAR